MANHPFSDKDYAWGQACLLQGRVKSLVFSQGTYQAEIIDQKASFWPVLSLDDRGQVLDAICSCSHEGNCPHEAACYLAIFQGKEEPLHRRFAKSFWHQLGSTLRKKWGVRVDLLVREEGWKAYSSEGDLLFAIHPRTQEGKDLLQELIENRLVETEETSLKFSNLSEEELLLWRQGRPSEALSYELSFWADLAKWFFIQQEQGVAYELFFLPVGAFPQEIQWVFQDIECHCFVTKEDWLGGMIPSLATVRSPLSVYEAQELQMIEYCETEKAFILHAGKQELEVPQGEKIGQWVFLPGKGFYRKTLDSLLCKSRIFGKEVNNLLSEHISFVRERIVQPIHERFHPLQYTIAFQDNGSLDITAFLFTPGDLQSPYAAFFGQWVYLPEKGFFFVGVSEWEGLHKNIQEKEISHYLEKHRRWFQECEGFQIHVLSVDAVFSYHVEANGDMLFSSQVNLVEEKARDLGDYIFVEGKGFFPKKKDRSLAFLQPGERIKKKDVPLFLRKHAGELLTFPGFFRSSCPVDDVSLQVLIQEGNVHIRPLFSLIPEVQGKRVLFYQEYVYVEGEGFSKVSSLPPVVEEYLEEKVLSWKEEALFLAHLKELTPWIAEMDTKLLVPKKTSLVLRGMEKKQEAHQWLLELCYETEYGSLPIWDVWQALHKKKEIFCSEAGLFDLTLKRFQWLKHLSAKRWSRKGRLLRLTTLEWIRLQATESLQLPRGKSVQEQHVRESFRSFSACEGHLPLDLKFLRSTLRPYQEIGVRWLWFLYNHGLSGLLCDEMGLGKTHQAMALLAAIAAQKPAPRAFLVICPTSVIYHWEKLLREFLPELSIYVYHGQDRQVEKLQCACDVIITSYGIVRSDVKIFGSIPFEVVIYDEIQQAKNIKSRTHKALSLLQVTTAIGLTGTPIENHMLELKALFDLLLPHYLPSQTQFNQQFVLPIEKEKDEQARDLLARLVKPFILRRKKSEVLLELPEKTEEIAYCDLSFEQEKLYKQLVSHYQRLIEQDQQTMHIFALFTKLKQLCDHPCLLTGEVHHYDKHTSGKWDLFVELLREARESRQKVVVFTQYLQMLDICKLYLSAQGIGFTEIRGSTRDRKAALEQFRLDPQCEVFLASLQAAGVGIDLTAASVVIHYDRWWNPAKENQATDRVHRMGQSRGVQVFKLLCKHTLEERIHELILKKGKLLDHIVGFDEQDVLKSLTKEELYALFSSLVTDQK